MVDISWSGDCCSVMSTCRRWEVGEQVVGLKKEALILLMCVSVNIGSETKTRTIRSTESFVKIS